MAQFSSNIDMPYSALQTDFVFKIPEWMENYVKTIRLINGSPVLLRMEIAGTWKTEPNDEFAMFVINVARENNSGDILVNRFVSKIWQSEFVREGKRHIVFQTTEHDSI